MSPVLIEVHCNLGNDDQRWQDIRGITLEIGYPGLHGQTLWKHIGWLQDHHAASVSAHALWNRTMPEHVLVFDFQPFVLPQHAKPEHSYCLRRSIIRENGRKQTSKPILVPDGEYRDDFFSCIPRYPEPEI